MADRKRLKVNESLDSTISEEDKNEQTVNLNEVNEKLVNLTSVLEGLVTEIRDISTTVKEIKNTVDKHDNLLSKLNTAVESNANAIRKVTSRLDKSNDDVKSMFSELQSCKDHIKNLEHQMSDLNSQRIELEARSRRNNLIFHGIEESKEENTLTVLQKFMEKELKMSNSKELLIQRVHRLGKSADNSNIGSRSKKHRPIIASFVDFRQREHVRQQRFNLSSRYGVSEDLPYEIRQARAVLEPELKELKQQKKRATIVYPAKLLVEGKVVREVKPGTVPRPHPGRR